MLRRKTICGVRHGCVVAHLVGLRFQHLSMPFPQRQSDELAILREITYVTRRQPGGIFKGLKGTVQLFTDSISR